MDEWMNVNVCQADGSLGSGGATCGFHGAAAAAPAALLSGSGPPGQPGVNAQVAKLEPLIKLHFPLCCDQASLRSPPRTTGSAIPPWPVVVGRNRTRNGNFSPETWTPRRCDLRKLCRPHGGGGGGDIKVAALLHLQMSRL